MMFKISIGYTNLDRRQTQMDLVAQPAFTLPLLPVWLDTQEKYLIW